MPVSAFPDREDWEVNDMAFRLEQIIVYARNYLLTTTYPEGPTKEMLNKEMEEYKAYQSRSLVSISLARDLMDLVPIFKQIQYP